jgi:acyl-coenzyme A synthetase/AMP-(fatty) acid ligase
MVDIATLKDVFEHEDKAPLEDRWSERTIYQRLCKTRDKFGDRPAISFQMFSSPRSAAETLTWSEFTKQVTQAANYFRSIGIGEKDVVAFLLPSTTDTAATLLGAMTAGIVAPINPTLEPLKISDILRETNAKAIVTLKSFPKSNIAQLAAFAVAHSPQVEHIIEIDLGRHLGYLKRRIADRMRPEFPLIHGAKMVDFHEEIAKQNADSLDFEENLENRICAYFHTGGTTGRPKIVQHRFQGVLYNGWLANDLMVDENDVVLSPLPLFHVFGAYPILMGAVFSGCHLILPTPAGYRGDDVFKNFWKLVARWKVTFVTTVPTAAAALMQVRVNADISSLKNVFCGSAPMPVQTFKKFQEVTGVEIIEGYGMTEATCIVSVNPKAGDIVNNPGVIYGKTYTDPVNNKEMYVGDRFLRTGDLGRVDDKGYVWLTGREKDIIIRSGVNIDPAMIEEALLKHPKVAFAGAIGQPDLKTGEMPCVYVELVDGETLSDTEILDWAKENIQDSRAIPQYAEVIYELPKTAIGKVFKPELRRRAITRTFGAAMREAELGAEVVDVVEHRLHGLIALLQRTNTDVTDKDVNKVLGGFERRWRWSDYEDKSEHLVPAKAAE